MTAAGDSAGITMVPLAELAPHPLNPRAGLGDLAELAASIADDRDQGQAAYECGWDCSRHRAADGDAGTADRRTG